MSRVDQVLEKIVQSGHKCALTGWAITPQCFEIDHIVSMNDGGTDEIDNLQCVHPLVNKAKGTMGNAQFIEMCVAVAEIAKSEGVERQPSRVTWSDVKSAIGAASAPHGG